MIIDRSVGHRHLGCYADISASPVIDLTASPVKDPAKRAVYGLPDIEPSEACVEVPFGIKRISYIAEYGLLRGDSLNISAVGEVSIAAKKCAGTYRIDVLRIIIPLVGIIHTHCPLQ